MEITYTSEKLTEEGDEPSNFSGSVTIRIPPFHERIAIPKKIGLSDFADIGGDDSKKTEKQKLDESLDQMGVIAKCAELIMPYLISCDLKNKEGVELKTADDFFSHPENSDLVMALVHKFISGFLTKKKTTFSPPK